MEKYIRLLIIHLAPISESNLSNYEDYVLKSVLLTLIIPHFLSNSFNYRF